MIPLKLKLKGAIIESYTIKSIVLIDIKFNLRKLMFP